MKLLAIETSSIACSLALMLDDQLVSVHQLLPLQQTKYILPFLDGLLKKSKITIKQIDAIAFGCGPGSFTGVRIATSIAQGLAYGVQCPVIPISSLAAQAQTAYRDLGWEKLLVVIDARIKEVYWGAYELNRCGLTTLLGKEVLSSPAQIALPLSYVADFNGIGSAWKIYHEQILVHPQCINITCLPSAVGVAILAKEKYLKHEWVEAIAVKPVYLRDHVANLS